MALDPKRLIEHDFPEVSQVLTQRDACLYALGIGLGENPLDDRELRYVYERHPHFRAVSTQPVTMGFFRWVLTPEFGIDVGRVVHGEERLTLHGPVPTEGRVLAKLRVLGIEDKGEGRGALVSTRRDIRLEGTAAPFASVETTTFCRGDGGCGSEGTTSRLSVPLPNRGADSKTEIRVRSDAALIYRLSGDYNPLHVDAEYARKAGFERPILHGLCTLAIASRAIWTGLEGPGDLLQIACRFSGIVWPGDTLIVSLWHEGNCVHFSAESGERTVLDQGSAIIG